MLEPDFERVVCYIYTENSGARRADFQGRPKCRGRDLARAQGFPEPSK